MTKTVIGMYGDTQIASSVVNDLVNAGFDRTDITVMGNNSGGGLGSIVGASERSLVDMGASAEQARLYVQGVNQGNALVAARVSDRQASEAQRIMERTGIMDVERRGQQGMTQNNKSGTSRATQDTARTGNREDDTIEVVQEDLQIGKRNVETGGVRINTYVHEVPVEQDVRLREEHVQVERRPVDRPATSADLDRIREESIEVRETQEKPVVSKEARVVEEVRVSKDVQERTATVRDTVRKTEVEVEQLGGQSTGATSGYDAYDTGFRSHWQSNYANSGMTYDRYQPAYRYGYTLANDQRYRGRNWSDVESTARREWENQNQGPWENFKDSVRYAWEQARGRA